MTYNRQAFDAFISGIFPDTIQAEDYSIVDDIMKGFQNDDYEAWERAGLALNNKGLVNYGSHCIRVSQGIQKTLAKRNKNANI